MLATIRLLTFVGVLLVTLTPVSLTGPGGAMLATVHASAAAQPDFDIDIDIDEGGAWYENPMWIAIGGIGLVVLILLVVMASRGGGRRS